MQQALKDELETASKASVFLGASAIELETFHTSTAVASLMYASCRPANGKATFAVQHDICLTGEHLWKVGGVPLCRSS